MRAVVRTAACATRDFGHGLLLPRGAASAAPALIYQSRSSPGAIRRFQGVHVLVRVGGDNRRATSEPADFRDSWLLRTPIAHRGLHAAHDGRPENSLAAFAHACALG